MTDLRELDIALHEALGHCAHVWEWRDRGAYHHIDDDKRCIKCRVVAGGEHVVNGKPEAPRYSTTAWQDLAEAMRQRGICVNVSWVADGNRLKGTLSCNCSVLSDGTVYIREADTIGEAVCLAARQALEARKGDDEKA